MCRCRMNKNWSHEIKKMLSKNHEIKQKHREIKEKTVGNMLYIEELPAENKQKQNILLPFLKKIACGARRLCGCRIPMSQIQLNI